MESPLYPRDDHYLYGSGFRYPYPPYYSNMWYHRNPPRRFLSDMVWFYDDGATYMLDSRPADPVTPVLRSAQANNIINIETVLVRSLRVKLYSVNEEDDIDITLELGRKYAIAYITEGGMKVAKGILKVIDSSIPDTCTRYIGEFNSNTITAYIGLDCSTEGNSDKRKIYIAAIRDIKDITEEDADITLDTESLSDSQKLTLLANGIPFYKQILEEILDKVTDPSNADIMEKLRDMDPDSKLKYIIDKIDSAKPILALEIQPANNQSNTNNNG